MIIVISILCITTLVKAEWTTSVGTVEVSLLENKFLLLENQEKLVKIEMYDSLMDTLYILKTPYKEIGGYDGIPDGNTHLLKITTKNFKKKFKNLKNYKFSFFNKKATTIGILSSSAGGSGGNSLSFYLFDTVSDKYAVIRTSDMSIPSWLGKNVEYPPKYAISASSYIGYRARSLGYNWNRISKVFSFNEDRNKFIRDKGIERVWFKKLYSKTKLTVKEINAIRYKSMDDEFNDEESRIVTKLLDNIRYANRLKIIHKLMPTIRKLDKSVQEDLSVYLKEK